MFTPSLPSPMDAVDAAWYHMESPENPMMVTGVMGFSKPLPFSDLENLLRSRLLSLPRFKEKVVDLAQFPHWVKDQEFKLEQHLHRQNAPAQLSESELQKVVSKIMSQGLEMDIPLWQITALGSENAIHTIVARIHHCIADGLGLIGVLLSLTGDAPAPNTEATTPWGGFLKIFKRFKTWPQALLPHEENIEKWARLPILGAQSLTTSANYFLRSHDSASVRQKALSPYKHAVWSQPLALERIKNIKKRSATTVNDVLMSALSGALRSYLEDKHAPVSELSFRAMVPVNLRKAHELSKLGNHFGLVYLDLPIAEHGPARRLFATRDQMNKLKQSPEAFISFALLKLLSLAPGELQQRIVELMTQKASAVVTNVPGPTETLTLAGAPISRLMFWAPCSGVLGLSISIFSYAGQVQVGLAADQVQLPDPEKILRYFENEITALEAALPET